MATYILNLLLYATDTFEEKIIFNSFFKVPFIERQRSRLFIHELDDQDIGPTYHCFRVYTLPYNDKSLSSYILSKELEKYLGNIYFYERLIEFFSLSYLGLVKCLLIQ